MHVINESVNSVQSTAPVSKYCSLLGTKFADHTPRNKKNTPSQIQFQMSATIDGLWTLYMMDMIRQNRTFTTANKQIHIGLILFKLSLKKGH